jgi:hypothetical protein
MTTKTCNCTRCPAFRRECEGCPEPCAYRDCTGECAVCPVRCGRRQDLDTWLASLDGLQLGAPLRAQPAFRLAPFVPQLLNRLEIPIPFRHLPDAAVAADKVLTPRGQVSKRALPRRPGPFSLRAQWRIDEGTRLICIGNCKDRFLESLWPVQQQDDDLWLRARTLGFEFATSLNFSLYLDQPRLEHLVNIKRSWLTVQRIQQTSTLIALPHLQWATRLDLERQLAYAQSQGFHTMTLNLQMIKRQGWGTVAMGLPDLHTSGGRFLFAGVAGLRRMALLARLFPGRASFATSTVHFLARRYTRLARDGLRLLKEPVEGHRDLILAANVDLYRDFLAGQNGRKPTPRPLPPAEAALLAAHHEVDAALRDRFGLSPQQARLAVERLAIDEAILSACRAWLQSDHLERDFRGSFPTWPYSQVAPHPTLGELLDEGRSPLEAFLRLADLARLVDDEIAVRVGEAGY